MEFRSLAQQVHGGGRVISQDVHPIRRIEVHVLAGERQYRMHQTVMLHCNGYDYVLESVLVLSFHRQDTAEMLIVVLPEYPVLGCFEAMEDRLHGNDR